MLNAVPTTAETLWSAVHAERAALADDLSGVSAEQWATRSLCSRWSIEEVLARLSAAASTGRVRWLRSMHAARFNPDVHNDRRLAAQRGPTPAATLARFQDLITSMTAHTTMTDSLKIAVPATSSRSSRTAWATSPRNPSSH